MQDRDKRNAGIRRHPDYLGVDDAGPRATDPAVPRCALHVGSGSVAALGALAVGAAAPVSRHSQEDTIARGRACN